jgi:undecaprenol kinase/diacylglycerol kinase (ATP)
MSNLINNIGFANEGILYFFKNERNGRIQAVIAVLVILLGFVAQLKAMEWCIVLGCVALTIGLEMMNTALERVCLMLSRDYHPVVKIIKDVSAAAVWWTSIFSAVIGLIIFVLHLKNLL